MLQKHSVTFVVQCMERICNPPDQYGIVERGKVHKNVSEICAARVGASIMSGWQTAPEEFEYGGLKLVYTTLLTHYSK